MKKIEMAGVSIKELIQYKEVIMITRNDKNEIEALSMGGNDDDDDRLMEIFTVIRNAYPNSSENKALLQTIKIDHYMNHVDHKQN